MAYTVFYLYKQEKLKLGFLVGLLLSTSGLYFSWEQNPTIGLLVGKLSLWLKELAPNWLLAIWLFPSDNLCRVGKFGLGWFVWIRGGSGGVECVGGSNDGVWSSRLGLQVGGGKKEGWIVFICGFDQLVWPWENNTGGKGFYLFYVGLVGGLGLGEGWFYGLGWYLVLGFM